ncbi:MAG TPA: TetR/AcrR family transcriptional regulator [Candidatus Sulfotelmatobacter sp.]|nr:TetR/AcrR family transcriptional regulator [Candidatus Sulfotelmatobacter sp.]
MSAEVKRPRTKPAAVRREELLDAAERRFVAHGVAATSVEEIVADAGVAKGTFYLYFDAKEALLPALRDRYATAFRVTLASAVARRKPDDWAGRLRTWVEVAVTDYLERAALHDVVFHTGGARVLDHHGDFPVVDDLAALLREGARAGAWSAETPRQTALMLFHALHGAVDDTIAGSEPVDRKRLTVALVRFFRRAVAAV